MAVLLPVCVLLAIVFPRLSRVFVALVGFALLYGVASIADHANETALSRPATQERCSVRTKTKDLQGFSPVTQVRVDRRTGAMAFCAHGAGCYDATKFELSSPCKLSASNFKDPDDFYFDAQ